MSERKKAKTDYLDAVAAYMQAPPAGAQERAARRRVEETWRVWSKHADEVFG